MRARIVRLLEISGAVISVFLPIAAALATYAYHHWPAITIPPALSQLGCPTAEIDQAVSTCTVAERESAECAAVKEPLWRLVEPVPADRSSTGPATTAATMNATELTNASEINLS
jgi:hypothetical protein